MSDLTPPQKEACALFWLQDLKLRPSPPPWRMVEIDGVVVTIPAGNLNAVKE